MNADKIVNSLKCCSRTDAHSIGCDSCPYEYCGDDCNNLCKNAAKLIESLQSQLNGLKANAMIQEHIIESGINPLDTDKIVRLTLDNVALKAELVAYKKYGEPCDWRAMKDSFKEVNRLLNDNRELMKQLSRIAEERDMAKDGIKQWVDICAEYNVSIVQFKKWAEKNKRRAE